jgi:tryptophan synthase alpha chain
MLHTIYTACLLAYLPLLPPLPSAGLLVPDIPLEETPEIRGVASTHGLELVLLTTPTTPQPRMRAIAESSQGFVYLVSLTGGRGWGHCV